jgi:hypothetical protein
MNLQSYQDKRGLLKQASGWGGRAGAVGTTRLATTSVELEVPT